MLAYTIGFLFIDYAISRKKILYKLILTLIFVFLLMPQFITAHAIFIQNALSNNFTNYINSPYKNPIIDRLAAIVPNNKKLILLDEFPAHNTFSEMTVQAIQYYGMFVPLVPAKYKVLNPDDSGEWFDAINSLAPYALKILSPDFIYVKNSALSRLPQQRRTDLKNPSYFLQVYNDGTGILYSVKNKYENKNDNQYTVKQIADKIPNNKTVYVDLFPGFQVIRKGLIAWLAKRTTLIGQPYSIGGDYYMYIETSSPFQGTSDGPEKVCADYVLANADRKPINDLCSGYTKIAEMKYVTLWEKENK
jgi:hypothetical protein